MKRAALAVGALVGCVGAVSSSPVTALAGRYSHHFQNSLVDGSSYWSDDVLEVVPVGPASAYVRASLQFYNGHSCDISGIAQARGDRLVYRPKDSDVKGCEFSVRVNGGSIALADKDGICRTYYCGARGGLDDDTAFAAKSRRPITYLPKLKASRQYKAALAEEAKK